MLEEAEEMVKKMERSGIGPDVFSYNQMVKGLCNANRPDKAYLLVVNKMEANGLADAVSYNNIIKAFCKGGHIGKAYKLFEEMGRKGIAPDLVTFTTLIKAFLKEGSSDIAKALLDRMSGMGLLPDHIFYTTIIDHLCKSGKVEMACSVFDDMIMQGVKPDVISYNALINRLRQNKSQVKLGYVILEIVLGASKSCELKILQFEATHCFVLEQWLSVVGFMFLFSFTACQSRLGRFLDLSRMCHF
ncbi:hypothetical protein REPUB_Repub01dG0085300 [Reevesia pubescens]